MQAIEISLVRRIVASYNIDSEEDPVNYKEALEDVDA